MCSFSLRPAPVVRTGVCTLKVGDCVRFQLFYCQITYLFSVLRVVEIIISSLVSSSVANLSSAVLLFCNPSPLIITRSCPRSCAITVPARKYATSPAMLLPMFHALLSHLASKSFSTSLYILRICFLPSPDLQPSRFETPEDFSELLSFVEC